jgi:para-nitrobenzyl esterase
VRTQWIALAAAFALAATGLAPARAEPVKTRSGLVEGVVEDGLGVYRGIPFAAPPVGELRWRPPAPAAGWSGVRKAEAFGPPCIGNGPSSREDCLYLNVWTPARSPREKLPVMVWIYGGGFGAGATSTPLFSGEQLARRGVVFVSIAYRVGPMGFFAHPGLSAESASHVSGNYGLLDQIAGLKWVQDNIAAFGGDPKRVTVFGESAGGIAVSMLAASPLAKGLFQAAMSESGGSFAPPRSPPLPGENLVRLKQAEQDGASMAGTLGARTVAALRALPPEAIAKAAGGGPPGSAIQGFGVWPIIDGWVIPDDQYRLYAAGRFNRTPVLIGINSDEGASFGAPSTLAAYQAMARSRFGPHAEALLAAYPADSDATAVQAARDLMRDLTFGWHNWVWARLQAKAGGPKVFYYYFDQKPPYPPGSRFASLKGAPHASELPYVFGHLDQQKLEWRADDRAISEAMVQYWTNFAKRGDPNGAGLAVWPPFEESRPMLMRFGGAPKAAPLPNPDQLKALDAYFAWRRSLTP